MDKIYIKTDFIKLGQAMKLSGFVEQGSDIKLYISEGIIYINGKKAFERGKKLYSGDIVEIKNKGSFQVYN